MRLPFGFGRRSGSGDGATGGGSGASPAPVPVSAPSRAWASLPPIQRTAGAMPLVAAPAAFAGGLPGATALPPIVQPLGHEVSSLATPGLVVARTRPVEAAAAGSIPAPVHRRAARPGRSSAAVAQRSTNAHDEHPHEAAEPASSAIAAVQPEPIRSLPTVSRMTIRMPDRPLTSAAAAARPAAVQRAAAAAAAAAPSSGPGLPAPSGGMRRVPAGGPANQPAVSREPASDTTPAPFAIAAAPSTRTGLGEPLTAAPASARPITAAAAPIVSRSTTAGPMPTAASTLRPAVQRAASSVPAQPLALPGTRTGAPPNATDAHASALPHLPVARSASSPGATPSSTPTTSAVAPAAQPTATTEIRPIAAANPIRPSIALQRSAPDEGAADDDAAGLRSPWWAPAAEATGPASFGAGSDLDGPSIQRSAAARPSSAFDADSEASSAARTDRRPVQAFARPSASAVQRSAGPGPRAAMPVRRAADDHTHAPSAPLAIDPADGRAVSAPGRSIVTEPVVQTSRAGGAIAVAVPGAAGAPHGSTVVQRETAAETPVAAPPTTQSGPRSERDLDDLAQALFGRIQRRIRSELIHDREAKGLTFDNI